MPRIVAPPQTDAWFEARKTALGASEIAAAAGLSIYQTPYELYLRKRGELPPIEDNDAMRLGRKLEPVVKSEFIERTGIVLIDDLPPMYRHDKFDEIVATPDGIISPDELLECKTANWRMRKFWGEEQTDAVPDQYLCQAAAQMAVMNAAKCHVAVLFDGQTLRLYEVLRNDELITLLIEAGLDLMERVRDARAPDPVWEHPTTHKILQIICRSTEDTKILLSQESQLLWNRRESIAEQIKALEAEQEGIMNRVNFEIGSHYAGVLDDGRMIKRIDIAPKFIEGYDRAGYSYLRAVKNDKGRTVECEGGLEIPLIEHVLQATIVALKAGGAKCRHHSDSGSSYWILPDGRQLRVSDHDPNPKTLEWMQTVQAVEYRLDQASETPDAAAHAAAYMKRLCS